jgi:hypothetical protein
MMDLGRLYGEFESRTTLWLSGLWTGLLQPVNGLRKHEHYQTHREESGAECSKLSAIRNRAEHPILEPRGPSDLALASISRAVETASRRVDVESPPSLFPHKPRRKPTNGQRVGPTDLWSKQADVGRDAHYRIRSAVFRTL